MRDEKGMVYSKTIIGVVVAVGAAFFGWGPEMQEIMAADLSELAKLGAVLAGLILTIYGRVTAKHKITSVHKKDNGNNILPSVVILCLLMGASAMVQGCAALRPTVEPQTVEESLYVAWAEYDAVLKTATDLNENGFISADLKVELAKRFDNIEAALHGTEALLKDGLGDTARDQLEMALQLLTMIQEELPDGT